MKDTIYIIGFGAVGKALAVALKLSGNDVVILRGSERNVSARFEHIVVETPDGLLEADVEISSPDNFTELNGIILFTNKSFANGELAEVLKGKVHGSPIVLLQNGLGVEKAFLERGFTEIYRCVLFITSQNLAGNKVSYKPVTVSPVGCVVANQNRLTEIVNVLNSPYFPFKVEPDIEPIIWKKAIVNSIFNSICPLLNIDNGIFQRDAAALAIAKRIIKECVAIAQRESIVLTELEVTDSLLMISKLSDGQLISTLQDINNKRRTEIDTLNIEIAAIAERQGHADEIKETLLLGELVRIKSFLNQ